MVVSQLFIKFSISFIYSESVGTPYFTGVARFGGAYLPSPYSLPFLIPLFMLLLSILIWVIIVYLYFPMLFWPIFSKKIFLLNYLKTTLLYIINKKLFTFTKNNCENSWQFKKCFFIFAYAFSDLEAII